VYERERERERERVALVTQHAKCMRRIILSYVACLAEPYFSILLYITNGTIFEKKRVTEHKMCVVIFFSTACV
jgi:hypothetical protein